MIHAPVPPEDWAAEGARSAGALEEVAAALVIGADPEVAAVVALAIAGAQRGDRRVAIADLVGAHAERPGLLECIRDGLPISGIARPHSADGRVFILPGGGPEVTQRLVLESARWPRLVAGFREVDALLLIVVAANATGLPTLLAAVDGVVAVDLPPALSRTFPLLATIDRPEPELPPLRPIPDRPPRPRRPRRFARNMAIVAAVAAATAAGYALLAPRDRASSPAPGNGTDSAVRTFAAPDTDSLAAALASVAAGSETSAVDTITLGALVNPDDSANAAGFAVELVAANTLSGANSGLAIRGATLPAPTLTPVLLGSDGRPWYRALTGAWHARAEAEAFLATLRDRGLVKDDVGRVLRAPYALRLAEGVPPEQARAMVAQWAARGISAYALLQQDGRASLYAGAFETPGQSVLVALSLRDSGVAPVLAFRTGRMF